MSQLTMFEDFDEFISSPESGDGTTPCDSLDGQPIGPSGQVPAPASPIRRRAREKVMQTTATSGPICFDSSASAALSRSLANKLMMRLGTDGSMEYQQTWRKKATPWARWYWEHTVLVRRKSGNGCTGWPTAKASTEGTSKKTIAMASLGDCEMSLARIVHTIVAESRILIGWPAPRANEVSNLTSEGMTKSGRMMRKSGETFNPNLSDIARFCRGPNSTSSDALTETGDESQGKLNPAFSLWLMGYPIEWMEVGIEAFSRLPIKKSSEEIPS